MPIKVSAQEVFLAETAVIDVDAMKAATASYDCSSCSSRSHTLRLARDQRLHGRGQARRHELATNSIGLELARALDHLGSDQQLLFRDPLDLRGVLSQHPVVHPWQHIV